MKMVFTWLSRLLFVLMLLYSGARLGDSWRWNVWATRLLKDGQIPRPPEIKRCSQKWLTGVAAGIRGDLEEQRQIWEQSLACSQHYLSLLHAAVPGDQELARLAAQLYPRNALAWFWLGETLFYTDQPASLPAYLHIVELEPRNGTAWCRLGWIYEGLGEAETAAEDFYKCCREGDPGRNGCFGAGRNMEKLGDLTQAISYYRLSRDPNAQSRADELQKQLTP
jgi:tetratricopeptide (TPR) repeat protein